MLLMGMALVGGAAVSLVGTSLLPLDQEVGTHASAAGAVLGIGLTAAAVNPAGNIGWVRAGILYGFVVLALRVAIPEHIAAWLEFGVALMIISLGVNALYRALRGRTDVHAHTHAHDGLIHAHLHFQDEDATANEPAPIAPNDSHAHAIKRIGIKPLLVGMMHGLAGSAALTLLVLSQIGSMSLGLLYLLIFGVGSIFGMLLMSSLIGLPFVLSAQRLTRFNHILQTIAGALSIAFGLWYAYETGFK